MNLSGSKGRLSALTKQILLEWRETRNYWRDAKSEEFERQHMADLMVSMDRALVIVDKLDELLKKVRSDCE
jgi:hypothetical protein